MVFIAPFQEKRKNSPNSFCFSLPTYATFSTNEKKYKTNPDPHARIFPRFTPVTVFVIASNSVGLIELFVFVVNGQSNCFCFDFTTLNWNALYQLELLANCKPSCGFIIALQDTPVKPPATCIAFLCGYCPISHHYMLLGRCWTRWWLDSADFDWGKFRSLFSLLSGHGRDIIYDWGKFRSLFSLLSGHGRDIIYGKQHPGSQTGHCRQGESPQSCSHPIGQAFVEAQCWAVPWPSSIPLGWRGRRNHCLHWSSSHAIGWGRGFTHVVAKKQGTVGRWYRGQDNFAIYWPRSVHGYTPTSPSYFSLKSLREWTINY